MGCLLSLQDFVDLFLSIRKHEKSSHPQVRALSVVRFLGAYFLAKSLFRFDRWFSRE